NDEMLLDMSFLLLHGGDAAAWEQMIERARTVAQGQELIEVLELAGIAALRRNDRSVATRWWVEALEAGKRIPNVMSDRIRRRLANPARPVFPHPSSRMATARRAKVIGPHIAAGQSTVRIANKSNLD